ncbi:hypothetical protein BDZ45DRAFT_670298 [Acephala macrosclerotiorum]|nr:hypothetical protein BDZ45DRAFT_670298 [Acephala macrosclerotiorum]
MTGLVNYGSSDEEDNVHDEIPSINASDSTTASKPTNGTQVETQLNGSRVGRNHEASEKRPPSPEPDAPLLGPTLAPAGAGDLLEEDTAMAPQSPYSVNRALLRDLTLPTIPNYDIPPSPPGSPSEATNAKFKLFLELKKQEVHFNEKLAKSSALKNPSLMQKLMDFSGIDEAGQYESTLPKEYWNPNTFPTHAYKEELVKSQQKVLKNIEENKVRGGRESVDFVPASTATEPSSRGGTPGNSGRYGQKSAAERVMAGLDRGRSGSPQVQGAKRKTRFEN